MQLRSKFTLAAANDAPTAQKLVVNAAFPYFYSYNITHSEMKKTTLLLGATLLAFGASAQFKTVQPYTAPIQDQSWHRAATPNVYGENAQSKTTAAAPRWYNHAEAIGSAYGVNIYTEALSTYNAMWQDSTVRFENNDGTPSATGINWMSYGESFAPQTDLYNATRYGVNRGRLRITASDPYTVDSVMVRGQYVRTNNSYNDTLMLVFLQDGPTVKIPFLSYAATSPIAGNHGIDSFAAMLWRASTYGSLRTQVSYQLTGVGSLPNADTIRIPLTQATFLDSLSDGSHQIKARISRNIPAGGRLMMSVTFKSGTTYTSGTPISDYNFFAFLSHQDQESGFVVYPPTDQNMSYMSLKDSTNSQLNSGLNIYTPTIAYTGTGTADFTAEVHNISWKASCATCIAVGVDEVATGLNIGRAYPNPANTSVTVPVTVTNAAPVSVTIANVLGQVIARQNFAATAGQTQNAVFSTEALANGVYLYTVESNGERVTDRIVVAH